MSGRIGNARAVHIRSGNTREQTELPPTSHALRPTPSNARFPATRLSILESAKSPDPEIRRRAHDVLAQVYWPVVNTYARLSFRLSPEDAEDVTQGFFADALRRDLFARYAPERARFRTYVRTCVDAFVLNAMKAERRMKRGGNATHVPLDPGAADLALSTVPDPDAVFHQEWVRAVFSSALDAMRVKYEATGKHQQFSAFVRYDVSGMSAATPPTYSDVAAELGVPVTQLTNWLAAVRRDFRSFVLDTLRTLSASDEEFRDDARALLGIDAP